jgi:D-serine deaminase-like pyridoxal phosphate-dependent protein
MLKLAENSLVKVAVDSRENVLALSQAAQTSGVTIGVLVEVNIGHNRCGVAPFEPTLELVTLVLGLRGLKFLGLMGYDGHCTLKVRESEREALSKRANSLLAETRKYIENAGIAVEIVSAGGSFTYRFASTVPGITEIQPGTYLLMDTAFREHGVREFECTQHSDDGHQPARLSRRAGYGGRRCGKQVHQPGAWPPGGEKYQRREGVFAER